MRSRLFRSLPLVLLSAIVAACDGSAPPLDDRDYVTRIQAARDAKDAEFMKGSSPVPDERKGELLPLAYFPIDPSFNVPASLKPSNDQRVFMMPTSTGQLRRERQAGTLEFTLRGQPMTLLAFVEADAPDVNRLFLPFADLTTGTSTYSGGRYLDLVRTSTGIYELDFNKAYTPYCYYNPSFDCPYPPAENRLKVPIEAGERMKDDGAS